MPAGLSYEDFVAAALDTQRQLSAQSLAEVFSALDQACMDSCSVHTCHAVLPLSPFHHAPPQKLQASLQDGDGFLTAEELTKGLKDCDIFANVDDIMQVPVQLWSAFLCAQTPACTACGASRLPWNVHA